MAVDEIILRQYNNRVVQLTNQAITVTAVWQDVTSKVINTKNVDSVGLWVDATINDARNLRFRAVGVPEAKSTEEYDLPIQTVDPDIIKLEAEFFEFEIDLDQKMVFQLSIGDLIPYIKIQVQAGTVGATPAVLNKVLASVNVGDD